MKKILLSLILISIPQLLFPFDGEPFGRANCAIVDSTGYIWLGTETGIVIVDPYGDAIPVQLDGVDDTRDILLAEDNFFILTPDSILSFNYKGRKSLSRKLPDSLTFVRILRVEPEITLLEAEGESFLVLADTITEVEVAASSEENRFYPPFDIAAIREEAEKRWRNISGELYNIKKEESFLFEKSDNKQNSLTIIFPQDIYDTLSYRQFIVLADSDFTFSLDTTLDYPGLMLSGSFSRVLEHYYATIDNSLFLPIILPSSISQKDSSMLPERYLEHTSLSNEEKEIASGLEKAHPEGNIGLLLALIRLWQTDPPDGLENFVHLARAVGIPTRYVRGSVDSIWAECYIRGYGWLPVEIGENILAKDSFRRTSCPKNFKNSDIIALSASARKDIFAGWAVKRTDSIPDFDFALAGVVPPDNVQIFGWEFRLEKEDSLLGIIAKSQNGEKKNFIFRENDREFNIQNMNISIWQTEKLKPVFLKITREKD